MPLLPDSPLLGKLEIVDVFDDFDGPKLFSCRSAADHHYFVVWIDGRNDTDVWLYAAVSQRRLAHIKSGDIDLHDAFANPETGIVFEVRIPRQSSETSVTPRSSESLTPDILPAPGERLEIKVETLPELTDDSLVATSRGSRRGAADFHFETAHRLRTEAPVGWLGRLMWRTQDVVDAIGQSLRGNPTARGIIPAEVLGQTQLLAVGAGGGSFAVRVVSMHADLFGESLATRALDELASLLAASKNPTKLRDLLAKLQTRSAVKYKHFIEALGEEGAGVRLTWADPVRGLRGTARLNSSDVPGVLAMVTRIEASLLPERRVTAVLIGANTRIRTFEIHDVDTGEKYTGRIGDTAMASASTATLNESYFATIRSRQEIVPATGEERIRWELIHLEPYRSDAGASRAG